jgi:hypothetical protein
MERLGEKGMAERGLLPPDEATLNAIHRRLDDLEVVRGTAWMIEDGGGYLEIEIDPWSRWSAWRAQRACRPIPAKAVRLPR